MQLCPFNYAILYSSWLYIASGQSTYKTNLRGEGLAGIASIELGYLICDLRGSFVYQTDKNFRVEHQWKVPNPWNAKRDANKNIYVVTYSGEFMHLGSDGSVKKLISNLDAPFDFDFAEDGVWISEQGTKDGKVSFWRPNSKSKFVRSVETKFNWKNPEGLVYVSGTLWVLDTELGQLVSVSPDGSAKAVMRNLGLPILIRESLNKLIVFTNNYEGTGPALLRIAP